MGPLGGAHSCIVAFKNYLKKITKTIREMLKQQILIGLHSKKCWVKYNPALGKYWTEHMLGCFQPTVANLLGSNPTAGSKQPNRGSSIFYPALGCI